MRVGERRTREIATGRKKDEWYEGVLEREEGEDKEIGAATKAKRKICWR